MTQLRTAIKLEPRPTPDRKPEPERSVRKTVGEDTDTTYRITLPKLEAAKFDAAMDSHRDALVAEWKRDHAGDDDGDDGDVGEVYGGARHGENPEGPSVQVPPFPNAADALMSWWRPGGTPMWRVARMVSTPPWSCIWTSRTAMLLFIWGRSCRRMIAGI